MKNNERIVEAFEFAYAAHKGAFKKSTTIPYIVHPLDVASNLMKNNAPNDVVVAGLLHDVVEDTHFTLSNIRDRFGDDVATLVNGASEPEELVNADDGKGKNWREQKVHSIEFIKDASHDIKLLTCADKLANIRDIIRDYDRLGEDVWKRFNAPKDSHTWYYGSMLEAFNEEDGSINDMPAFKEYEKCVGKVLWVVGACCD
ncbi:MAG: HD domain-containing protein [Bacteroidales bacterium]|nr:HD domain-containing protein [Bacteroidales bacterium]